MRILDRILAGETVEPVTGTLPPAAGAFAQAQHVQIDNVADYILGDAKVGQSWSLTEDFPTLAPPFELAWYEYRRPPTIPSIRAITDSDDDKVPGLPDQIGVLVEGVRTEDGGFVSRYYVYSTVAKMAIRGPFVFQIGCDEHGRATPDGISVEVLHNVSDFERRTRMYWEAGADLLVPVLMATSLLHSKNVTIERESPIEAGLQRHHRRRYGTDRIRFHLLHIEPMRRVLRDAGAESDAAGAGLQVAMHIRRGYFGDYREGRGLFGKYHGIYWWDQMVKGKASAGLVTKEYVVHPAKGA